MILPFSCYHASSGGRPLPKLSLYIIIQRVEDRFRRKHKIQHCNVCFLSFFFPEPKISPATFCHVFPFHLMFDRDLNVLQTGCTITRVIPMVQGTEPCKLTQILYPVGVNTHTHT